MIRDHMLEFLSGTSVGASIKGIMEQCELKMDSEMTAALEILCHYMPEIIRDGDKWKIAQVGSSSKILAAIENYAMSSGKRIFRLSSALAAIPAHEHPTEDELKQSLEMSHGKFQLLPNAMIKRNS